MGWNLPRLGRVKKKELYLWKTKIHCQLIPHSHQNLSCLKSGVNYSSTVSLPINQEQSTPLLRQIKFWCECGITGVDETKQSTLLEGKSVLRVIAHGLIWGGGRLLLP